MKPVAPTILLEEQPGASSAYSFSWLEVEILRTGEFVGSSSTFHLSRKDYMRIDNVSSKIVFEVAAMDNLFSLINRGECHVSSHWFFELYTNYILYFQMLERLAGGKLEITSEIGFPMVVSHKNDLKLAENLLSQIKTPPDLFDFHKIDTDTTVTKHLRLGFFIDSDPRLGQFASNITNILARVRLAFEKYNISIDVEMLHHVPASQIDKDPSKYQIVEVYSSEKWLARVESILGSTNRDFQRLLHPADVIEFKGFALTRNTSLIVVDSLQDKSLLSQHAAGGFTLNQLMNKYWAKNIVHEISHNFELFHSFDHTSDPVNDINENKTPNIMSYKIDYRTEPVGAEFNKWQAKMLHSFLGDQKAYRALSMLDFNYRIFALLVNLNSGFH